MKASLIIIGNEILSGRTQDKNLSYLATWLNEIGIQLSEVRVIRDEENEIVSTVNLLKEKYDYVFTTGGIGPTHDDITTESIAKAFGVEIEVNNEALNILKEYYKDSELTDARMKMAKIPKGAELVDNPVSKAPGFKIENVFVMAGIPKIMQGMLEGARKHLKSGDIVKSDFIDAYVPESYVAEELSAIQDNYPDVEIGSYPFTSPDGKYGTSLVMRSSNTSLMSQCKAELEKMVENLSSN